jgi:hypothetical protein
MCNILSIDEGDWYGIARTSYAADLPVRNFATVCGSCTSIPTAGKVYDSASAVASLARVVAIDWVCVDAIGGCGLCQLLVNRDYNIRLLTQENSCARTTRSRNTYPAVSVTATASIQRTYLILLWSIDATLCYVAVRDVIRNGRFCAICRLEVTPL